MNRANRENGPLEGRGSALHVVPAPRGDPLVIDGGVAGCWWRLGGVARARVSAFLSGAPVPGNALELLRPNDDLPEELAKDLAYGGVLLRAAFPLLARSVVAIERDGDQTTARVRCLGDHRGAFFRILSPTGRRAVFDVVHRIVGSAAGGVRHGVALDLRAIVVQLVERRRPDTGGASHTLSAGALVRP